MVMLLDQNDIDHRLSASVKKLLLERIDFNEAKTIDEGEQLSQKYHAINNGYKAPTLKSLSTTVNNSSFTNNKVNTIPGVPNPSTILFNEAKIHLKWKQIRKIGPGLANLGNTCFLNSVLQVLTYTPPLANYILEGEHKQKCKAIGFCMLCELCNHVMRIFRYNPNELVVRPMSIIQKLRNIGKNFRVGRQEDAHEFLRYVVEAIQKSDYAGKPKLDKHSKETTLANAVFGGYYRSQVKCLNCQHESNTYDPMMDMNLDIKDCSSIIQALQKSVRPDRLDGENKYHCERCRKKTIAQKRGNIHKEPNVLTFQLKRFDFTQMFGGKISKSVSFPEEMNVRPYMSTNQGHPMVYKLFAVLVHSGYSCNSGHYYCYVKGPNGTWYEMNDSRVCQVGLNTVLSAQAYLLFYVKKEKIHQPTSNYMSDVKTPTTKSARPSEGLFKSLTDVFTKSKHAENQQQKKLTLNRTVPLGTPIARKPAPKIIWNNELTKPAKKDVMPLQKIEPNTLKKNNVTTNTNDNKTSLNSLQRLSQSYEDSEESPSSSVPSSPSNRHKQTTIETTNSDPAMIRSPQQSQTNTHSPKNVTMKKEISSESKTNPMKISSNISQEENVTTEMKNKESKKDTSSSSPYGEETPNKRKLSLPLNVSSNNSDDTVPVVNKRKSISHQICGSSKFLRWTPKTKVPLMSKVIIHTKLSPSKNQKQSSPVEVERSYIEQIKKTPDKQRKVITSDHSKVSPNRSKISSDESKVLSDQKKLSSDQRTDITNSLNEQRKHSPSKKISHEKVDKSSCKVRSSSPLKYFGPVLPPSSSILDLPTTTMTRTRNDSLNSEASSVSSVHSRSGDWAVIENEANKTYERDSLIKERQHAGWKVDDSERKMENIKKNRKRRKSSSSRDSDEDSTPPPKKKKKKSKKKKHKKEKRHNEDSDSEVYSERKNKKKKRKKKRKHKRSRHESSESDVEPFLKDNDESLSHHHNKSRSRESDCDSRDKNKSLMSDNRETTSTEGKNLKENHSAKSKGVPTFNWDDSKKKNVKSWDGSIKKRSSTLDYLISGSSKVLSWSGEKSSRVCSDERNVRDKERSQDEYDEDYDRGRIKKTKKINREDHSLNESRHGEKGNDFQRLQDYRNHTKDTSASFRTPNTSSSTHHHRSSSTKHKDKHKHLEENVKKFF